MVTTSLAVFALTGAVAAAAPSPQPNWQTDYATAYKLAAAQQKPLAVFIGHGVTGQAKLLADGDMPAAAAKLLKAEYVTLYIDADTASGKALAQTFEMSEGLVVSDRTGNKQAVRHVGTVAGSNLTQYLEKYSDPKLVVATTETNVAPAAVVAPAAAPAPVFMYPSYSTPTCRTCR